jgi:hypothetical protein
MWGIGVKEIDYQVKKTNDSALVDGLKWVIKKTMAEGITENVETHIMIKDKLLAERCQSG